LPAARRAFLLEFDMSPEDKARLQTIVPESYRWLLDEPGPRMLSIGLSMYGTLEAKGDANNPVILGWQRELQAAGHGRQYGSIYSRDSIPWCGLWMAVVAHRANVERRPERAPPRDYLAAYEWRLFGREIPRNRAALGDVCIIRRTGGNHVFQYVGEDGVAFHGLGANQSDAVNIRRFHKDRILFVRRPDYRNVPANVRKIILSPDGVLSKSEA
jgi:uncharacterized protein (TIGR02594 family)